MRISLGPRPRAFPAAGGASRRWAATRRDRGVALFRSWSSRLDGGYQPLTRGPGHFLTQLEGLRERARHLAMLLRGQRIDLVHTNSIVILEGALAAAWLGLPHVWHSRGLFGDGFPPRYMDDTEFFLASIDALADAIVCVSRKVERQAATVCQRARRAVIYDGFDLDRFVAQPGSQASAIRQRLSLTQSARVVACVGEIQRRKGQLDLVEAAAPLVGQFAELVFILAGNVTDVEYCGMLDQRIAALGLQASVRRIGFEANIRDLLSVSEALVHPSHCKESV